jgi:hypothetical protein
MLVPCWKIGALIVALLLSLLLLAGVVIRAKTSCRRQSEQMRRILLDKERLGCALRMLYLERMHLLEDLADLYFDLQDDDATLLRRKDRTREEVFRTFQRKLGVLRSKESILAGIARTVDMVKDGAASLMDRAFPKMRADERTVLLLMFLEADSSVQAYFNRKAAGTLRSIKCRFLRKVEASSLSEKEKEILRNAFQKRG